uniref:Uncharacterized protein LOC114347753 n=1 Tax=Diabrotica virgifera virgifera TaxID=50390 RepID=A0A6P7GXN9_DIAVI
MLLQELTVKQLREQLEERDLDSSGLKIVLQARLEEVLTKNGDDPETFHFQSAEQAILSKLKTVSETIDETSRKNNEKLEEVSRQNNEKLEEVSRQNNEKFE